MLAKTDEGIVTIDAGAVAPGSYIPAEALEDALGVGRETTGYAFALLRLCQQVEADLRRLGRPAMVRVEAHGVRVMSADEAADYTSRRFVGAMRAAESVHRRMENVAASATGMSADVRERHDRAAAIRVRVLAAVRRDLAAAEEVAALTDGE